MKRQKVINESHVFIKTQSENIQLQDSNIANESKTIQIYIQTPGRQKNMQNDPQINSMSTIFNKNKLPKSMKDFLKQKRIVSEISLNATKKRKQNNNQQLLNQINPIETNEFILQTQQPNHPEPKPQKKRTSKAQVKNIRSSVYPQIARLCSICQGKMQIKNIQNPAFNCEHVFCFDCTKNYILYKINRFEEIYCPNQNCKETLNQKSNFYTLKIPLKERKKYQKIHNFYQINQSNQLQKLCPKQQCEGILKINLNQPLTMCKICNVEFCSKCFNPAHLDQCEDFQTKFLKQNFNLVQCQRCKNFIQKKEGCHHITCKCSYQFCQKCKKPWQGRHICKYTILNSASQGWGGCDWGITKRDHIIFLSKIPLKAILLVLCTSFWIILSFLAVPLNLLIAFYWLYLVLFRPTVDMIINEGDSWKILIWIFLFPFLMIFNLCKGRQNLVTHLDWLFPEIPNSFRWIIRI